MNSSKPQRPDLSRFFERHFSFPPALKRTRSYFQYSLAITATLSLLNTADLRALVPTPLLLTLGCSASQEASTEYRFDEERRVCVNDENETGLNHVGLGKRVFSDLFSHVTDFECAYLRGTNFKRFSYNGIVLLGADLSGADAYKADLSYADFRNANLTGVNFERAILTGANFSGANLRGTNFDQANLYNANFQRTDLTQTSFVETNVAGIDVTGSIGISRILQSGRNLMLIKGLSADDQETAEIQHSIWLEDMKARELERERKERDE